jgi:putative flippase GtrA
MLVTDAPKSRPLNAAAEAKTGMRFFIVSVGAFAADFVIAMGLRELFGLSLPVAATIAFVTAWFGSYLGHEYWTFRGADRAAGTQASAGRLTRNLISNLTALSVRVVILIALEAIHVPESQILAAAFYLFAAGCSFTVNFLINRFWVFARK